MLANILPLLLKLLDGAEGEGGQAARPLPGKTAGSAAGSATAGSRQAPEAGRGEGSLAWPEGSGPLLAGTPSSPQDTALLLPLALKSLHFREAGFYLVLNNPEERGKVSPEEKEGLTLLLVLKTAHLGVLRIFFFHHRDDLRLSWLTQTEAVKEYLKKGFPELEAELSGAGYANVTVDIRRLPEEAERESAHSRPHRKAQDHFFDLYI